MFHCLRSATALAALLGGAALVALASSENRADAAASAARSTVSQASVKPSTTARTSIQPSTAAQQYVALEVGGVKAGTARSASGGNARGGVTGSLANKRVFGVEYTAITVTGGGAMKKVFWDWVGGAVAGTGPMKSGALVGYAANGQVRWRQSYQDGRISEVEFPALSGSDQQTIELRVVFQPRKTTRESASGTVQTQGQGAASWLANQYALTISGVEEATSHVVRIEPLLVRTAATNADISNLVIYVPSSQAEPLYAWHDDFVIKGNGKEKTGTLTYLGSGGASDVLATIGFRGLGILEVGLDPASNGQQTRAEMYVESMTFSTKP
jgi:hypothetical protein